MFHAIMLEKIIYTKDILFYLVIVMEKTKICPKCQGEMEKGLMITPGAVVGVRWVKGIPNWLFGTRVWGKPKIFAYSCVKCGFIESYVEKK
ncbi:hypothetical protein JXB41_07775 [Candidatus Woesearchaeota archaeon]|nr:hypothetical protein [Candidatus Woesearchaeota archaeon]